MNKSYDEILDIWNVNIDIDVDMYTIPKLREIIDECIQAHKCDIIIDCTNMSYIDSTGLGVLVSLNKNVKVYGGSIIITGLKPHIKRIFTITGLENVFNLDAGEA